MIKLTNQSGQSLTLVYSSKGHLVFVFNNGSARISSVCYYSHELAYNSRLLKIAADSILTNEQQIRQWLKQVTLTFTTANNERITINFTDNEIIVRCIGQQGELYSFVTVFDVPTFLAIADYISQWVIVSAIVDSQQTRRQQRQQYQPQQFNQYQQSMQQFNQQPQYYQQPIQPIQTTNNQQIQQPITNNQQQMNNGEIPFPSPDEV